MIDIVTAMETVVAAAAAGQRPGAAELRDSTLGAAIVWRAVDRAAQAGADPATAAEAGLQAAAGYLRLASELRPPAEATKLTHCVERLMNELRSRVEPSHAGCDLVHHAALER